MIFTKRALFLIAVFVTTSSTVYAQSFGIGARIGPSLSTLITDDEDVQETLTFVGGGQVDVYAYKMFNKFVGIEGGLMFTQAGFGVDIDSDDFDEEYNTKITYFAVPVSVRFKFGYFTLNSGVRPSFLIKAKGSGGDVTDQVRTADVGAFVSPGLQFPIGITLSSTIYVGMVDVFKNTGMDIANTNFSLQFSVGYTFLRKSE